MPSHLTRHVFRRLLANQPIVSRSCAHRLYLPNHERIEYLGTPGRIQRRRAWNLFEKSVEQREVKQTPGLGRLEQYTYLQSVRARPPELVLILEAFRKFFGHKSHRREPVEDNHIQLALNALRHICNLGDARPWRNKSDLGQIWSVLRMKPKEMGSSHLEFTRFLYSHLDQNQQESFLDPYIECLCEYGGAVDALALTDQVSRENQRIVQERKASLWRKVLKGFANEGNQKGISDTVSKIESSPIGSDQYMCHQLIDFFCAQGDVEQAKKWYEVTQKLHGVTTKTLSSLLKLCAFQSSIQWGQDLLRSLLEGNPNKEAWDTIFVFSVATGKSVDEIDRMFNVMARRGEEQGNPECTPDTGSINALVELAMARKDPYLAERFLTMGTKRGIRPNAKTFILQMQYRLSTGDIDGARSAYANLQREGTEGNEDVPVINKLVQAMCKSGRYDFNSIMAVVDDLSERRVRFDPETVSVLCELHMGRDELHEVIDLLQNHASSYGSKARQGIQAIFMNFCLNKNNKQAVIWDVYSILHEMFPDTSRSVRTAIMNIFFDQERQDMACHAFLHMRETDLTEVRANRDTYVAALTGIAKNADNQVLAIVHNQLKLDYEVELNTQLYNALMLAYTGCSMPRRSLEFWDDLVASKEGPSYTSIILAFRACEVAPFGDGKAKEIWERLIQLDLEMTSNVLAAYVGALSGNQVLDEAEHLIRVAKEKFGVDVDALILGSYYNAALGPSKKKRAEAWIRQHYPVIWEELESKGTTPDKENGDMLFNIDRSVKV